MKLLRTLALAAALAGSSLPASADKIVTYTLDPGHTQVSFTWSHLGFSSPGAVFSDVTGTIEGNQDNPAQSTISVSIPVKSLDSHVALLNEHLIASGDYFKSKEFPTLTFRSKEIRDLNRTAQTFKLVGDLTVNGITREVVLEGKLNKRAPHPFYDNAEAVGFNAGTTIKRSDFGMGKHVPMVSDELDVKITAEAVEAKAYQAAMEKMKAAAAQQKKKPAKKAKGKQ